MKAFDPQGIPGNRRPAPYNQFPVIHSNRLHRFPIVHSNRLPDGTELRQLPAVYGTPLPTSEADELRQCPIIHSNRLPDGTELRQLPIVIAGKLRQFPIIDGS
jgi:hypothetical protein